MPRAVCRPRHGLVSVIGVRRELVFLYPKKQTLARAVGSHPLKPVQFVPVAYLPRSCGDGAGVGGLRREEHGHQRPSSDARLSLLREEDEDTVREGES